MHDVAIFLTVIVVVAVIAIVITAMERIGKCSHEWSHWRYTEAEHAYVQQRCCAKCGYTETEQFRKMKEVASVDH